MLASLEHAQRIEPLVIAAHYEGDFRMKLEFSDGSIGEFGGRMLLLRNGSLLAPLRDNVHLHETV